MNRKAYFSSQRSTCPSHSQNFSLVSSIHSFIHIISVEIIEQGGRKHRVMASYGAAEPEEAPRLLLLMKPHHHYSYPNSPQSPERSGMRTPPLHTSVSVPFRWEEEPGKPRESTKDPIFNENPVELIQKCLDPPPRLFQEAQFGNKFSPTTVLEGPYLGRRTKFQSSSFRIVGRREYSYGSFRRRRRSCSPERSQLGAMVVGKPNSFGIKERVLFGGSWGFGKKGLKGKSGGRNNGGSSYIFPSLLDREAADDVTNYGSDEEEEGSRIRRTASFTSVFHTRPAFWTTIYEGLKRVVPWRSRKLKKDGFAL